MKVCYLPVLEDDNYLEFPMVSHMMIARLHLRVAVASSPREIAGLAVSAISIWSSSSLNLFVIQAT